VDGRALDEGARRSQSQQAKNAFVHMIAQLKAAKSTGQRVYLGVSDAIAENMDLLEELLRNYRLADVTIVTFSEAKFKEVAATLRKGLGLAGGVATVATDQITKDDADD